MCEESDRAGLTHRQREDILIYMETRETQSIIDNIWSQRVALDHATNPMLMSTVGKAIDRGMAELHKRAAAGDPVAIGFCLMDRAY